MHALGIEDAPHILAVHGLQVWYLVLVDLSKAFLEELFGFLARRLPQMLLLLPSLLMPFALGLTMATLLASSSLIAATGRSTAGMLITLTMALAFAVAAMLALIFVRALVLASTAFLSLSINIALTTMASAVSLLVLVLSPAAGLGAPTTAGGTAMVAARAEAKVWSEATALEKHDEVKGFLIAGVLLSDYDPDFHVVQAHSLRERSQ